MQTILTTSLDDAAAFIKRGGVVAFPTETVYGLGANVFDETAIAKIFAAKRRPNDNPLIAHVGELAQISLLATEITASARLFIAAFFPAPLTLLLPKSARVPFAATANLETIGVRMPDHQLARQFINVCGVPLVAPSANLSGKPSPTGWRAVREDLDGRIECILQGETTRIGLESTVVDCTSGAPSVLRTGAVTLEKLREIVPETYLYQLKKDEQPKSPGLKHRHYSPRARVSMTSSPPPAVRAADYSSSAYIGLNEPAGNFGLVKICSSVEAYARDFFAFFRECDHRGITHIYCETVAESGIGAALMDRLKRAAEPES